MGAISHSHGRGPAGCCSSSPHRGSGARCEAPWVVLLPVLRQALRVATRPVSVVPSRYGSAGVDHRHPEGEARWRLSSIASDRCNVFGVLPTRPRTLRLDTPEARRRRSFRLLNQGGSHTPFPSPASFLEGTSTPEPNTSTATRPTHRHPGFRTSPGPPSCQCGGSICPFRAWWILEGAIPHLLRLER